MNSVRDVAIERPRPAPLAARVLIHWLTRIRSGRIEGQLPSGQAFVIRTGRDGPTGVLNLHAPARLLVRAATRGALGFGESYVAGDWSSPDLTALLTLLAANERHLGTAAEASWLSRLTLALRHWRNANTRRGSRRNIAAHYDLGNRFYRLWLDETMTYSGAVFGDPDECLADAQRRKYAELLDRLAVGPGDRILEIGCGWGGFAEAAAERGAHVTGVTLSREQLAYARERLADAGLAEAVDLRLQDYREIEGTFDHVVSIEMLEAVGERYWPVYFDVLARRVRPGGLIALHGITIDPDYFEGYRASPDFIQRYIFPGGMLPTAAHLRGQARRAGLTLVSEDQLGARYARTIAHWHQRFCEMLDAVREQGFDERFIRTWRYYLAYCEAGFRTGRIDLDRLILRHPGE